MTLRNRIGKLEKAVAPEPVFAPLTVVLIETAPGQPAGRSERTNSVGLPVLEIAYDPAVGPGPLPRESYKLVLGVDPVDLV
jgi:hypothetical protein